MNPKTLILIMSCAMMLSSNAFAQKKWTLTDTETNILLAGDVCEAIGLKEYGGGRKRFYVRGWSKADEVFTWPVEASQAGKARVIALWRAPVGTRIHVKSTNDASVIEITDRMWHRIETELQIAENDTVTVSLENDLVAQEGQRGEPAIDFVGIEVITETYIPLYEQRIAELRTPIEEAAWFQNSGFGIMFQWGNWGYPRTGDRKSPWNKVYEDFDIEAFADKMKELDPGYIIWSITWRGSRFSAPLTSVDEIMGNSEYTMDYDFLGKLADALDERGIPMMLYYHPGAEEAGFWKTVWRGYDDTALWEDANVAIWTEIGEKLGDKLDGWFVDDGMAQYYPGPFHRYAVALKAGNPNRLITFNPFRTSNVSPFDEMSMGEKSAPGKKENGIFINGPTKGMMAHSMFPIDVSGWGIYRPNSELRLKKRPLEKWQAQVDQAKRDKHPLSFCIGMFEDGSLNPETEELLRALSR